jgi:hypothetical protein
MLLGLSAVLSTPSSSAMRAYALMFNIWKIKTSLHFLKLDILKIYFEICDFETLKFPSIAACCWLPPVAGSVGMACCSHVMCAIARGPWQGPPS